MPRVLDWETEKVPPSERRFLAAAKRDLPGDWIVIHGLIIKTVKPVRIQEVDFVVIDPDRGILIIEVKGGGINRRGNEWYSIDHAGDCHLIKDPVSQSERCRYRIRDRLNESLHYGRGNSRRRVPEMISAVSFPDIVQTNADLGPDLPVDLVIDSSDLRDLKSALDRIFNKHPKKPLSAHDVEAFCRTLEPPHYMLPRSLAARLDTNRDALERLTEEQARILTILENHRRVAIEGAAGTGKTVLAQIKATQLAKQGNRVLFLCFNRALADALSTSAEDDGFRATNFHRFCRQCAVDAGLAFTPPSENEAKKKFWANRAPSILMDALDRLPECRFDAIVVDEAQDFKPDWWAVIDEALENDMDGVLYAFFDPRQKIYCGALPKGLGVSPYPLKVNCRNTRRIAEHAASFVGIEYELRPETPTGAAVETINYSTPNEMVERVRQQLHRLVQKEKIATDKITVLSTRSPENSPLSQPRKLGNFSLKEIPERRSHIRFTSLHAFKGLESDVVILTDVDGYPKSRTKTRLYYVAATRARTLLVVLRQVC